MGQAGLAKGDGTIHEEMPALPETAKPSVRQMREEKLAAQARVRYPPLAGLTGLARPRAQAQAEAWACAAELALSAFVDDICGRRILESR